MLVVREPGPAEPQHRPYQVQHEQHEAQRIADEGAGVDIEEGDDAVPVRDDKRVRAQLPDGDDDGEPQPRSLDDAATDKRASQRHRRHGRALHRHAGELGHQAGKDLGHAAHLHERMHHQTLTEALLLFVGALGCCIDLAERELAIAQQAADEALLHDDRLHAVDAHALELMLQQAAFHLYAVVAPTGSEAAERDGAAHDGQKPHDGCNNQHQSHAGSHEVAAEQLAAQEHELADKRIYHAGEDRCHLAGELGCAA